MKNSSLVALGTEKSPFPMTLGTKEGPNPVGFNLSLLGTVPDALAKDFEKLSCEGAV